MIPTVEEIQEALRLGRITEREAEAELFFIALVERDFRASQASSTRITARSPIKDPETIQTPVENALCS